MKELELEELGKNIWLGKRKCDHMARARYATEYVGAKLQSGIVLFVAMPASFLTAMQ